MEVKTKDLAIRGYFKRFLGFMAFSLSISCLTLSITYLAAWELIRHHPTGELSYLLAILIALLLIGGMVIAGLYLTKMTAKLDEVERAKMVRSLLGGLVGILAVTTIWGFLEAVALAPHMNGLFVLPLFSFFTTVSYFLGKRRYE
jgi:hypothetical protein